MWPYMGSMGWWMVLWWLVAIVVLVLVVRLVTGSLGDLARGQMRRRSKS